MILNKLTIENFGKVKQYEASFDSRLTIVSDSNADDIIKAIGVVTDNKSLYGHITKEMLSENTSVSAEIEALGKQFLINARGSPTNGGYEYNLFESNGTHRVNPSELFTNIRLCEEEENLTYYRFNKRNDYPERFLHYKDPEKYYSSKIFRKITDGIGLTRCFRSCLSEYIKRFESGCVTFGKYNINILPDGKIIGGGTNGLSHFDETKARLFDCICFLSINDFWEGFEDIRNFNYEKRPIIIDATGLGTLIDIEKTLEKFSKSGRQLIVKRP